MATTVEPPLTGDDKHAEIQDVLQDVVKMFSSSDDMAAVRESGKMTADLHATQLERHQKMTEAIRGLTGQLQRAKQEHAERRSTVLDETQKTQLLGERSRVDENIRRLVLVRRTATHWSCARAPRTHRRTCMHASRRLSHDHASRAAARARRRTRDCSRASPRAIRKQRSCLHASSSASSRRAWRCRAPST